MSSPDRPDGSSGETGNGSADPDNREDPEPLERSARGRFVIRSSSHPPRGGAHEGESRDVSGARPLPRSEPAPNESEEGRSKRSTPAERPRRRKQIALERTLRDTLPARPQSLRSKREHDTPRIDEPEPSVDEAWDEQARLDVIAVDAEAELQKTASQPPAPAALTPPPPAGAAAIETVPQPIGEEPQSDAPAHGLRVGAVVGLALVIAALVWVLFHR